eukprot:6578556-Lingulodinium_polyedra.AAC.1
MCVGHHRASTPVPGPPQGFHIGPPQGFHTGFQTCVWAATWLPHCGEGNNGVATLVSWPPPGFHTVARTTTGLPRWCMGDHGVSTLG